MKPLKDKKALITGGGGGIGSAIAHRLGALGAEIILTDLSPEAMDEKAEALREKGYRVSTFTMDVTQEASIEEAREAIATDVGRVDILVNNAGVVFGGAFLDTPMAKHRLTYEVNTMGVVAMTHAFLGDLIAGERTYLVNIASASGFIGLPWGSTYASSKWAVIGFSESIRMEMKEMGHSHLTVTTVCPSYVDTGMFEGAQAPMLTKFLTPETLANKVWEAMKDKDPLVLEPWLVKLTPSIKALLPTGLSDRLADLTGATASMKGWKGKS